MIISGLLATFFVGGIFFGYQKTPAIEKITVLFNKEAAKPAEVDFSPFWSAWAMVESKFVKANNGLDEQKMVWGAIQGMVKSLDDPYSVFFPPQEAKMFQEDISGEFQGVGMEIGIRDEVLTVIAPLKNTPAWRAGIKSGDKIIKIDDTLTFGLATDEAVSLIRGEGGTEVLLTIAREGEDKNLEIAITRDVIKIPVIESETKPGGIFVIKLYNFGGNSISAFRQELRNFAFSENDKLIIDLRGNAGGYLEAAVDITSWFLPSGKTVVLEKFGTGEEKAYRSKGYNAFEGLPMVVLVNKGSASASEIMAGALQEHGIATLVGEKTFGKGSVQELVTIAQKASLKLTIAYWLTPNGKSISDEGLEPDIKVEMTKEDFEKDRDPQMEKAIELLNNKQ